MKFSTSFAILTALSAVFAAAVHTRSHDDGVAEGCTLYASGGDDSPAIEKAFKECRTVVIPEDQNLSLATKLNTTGLVDTHIKLHGGITINPDIDYWRDNAFNVTYQVNSVTWLLGGKNVLFEGGGFLDGNGQTFYDARIQNDTLRPPHFVLLYKADGFTLRNIRIRQSPRWTILVHTSKNVLIHDLDVRSRSNTWANGRESNRETDGVDIYDSDQITLHNLKIDNGDDCVSFKPNATNIYVSNIWCNGTHGVSVGSLGEYDGVKDIVENVYVNNVTIVNSENGPRIKTWSGPGRGYGYVKQIVFSNFWHENNDSPITIDNCYKTTPDDCLTYPSEMTITDVYFNNQYGSSSGKYGNIVAALSCSVGACKDIFMDNVDLKAPEQCGTIDVYSNSHVNVQGNAAYKFTVDAPTFGAGGILPNNATVGGVTCENGAVVTPSAATSAVATAATSASVSAAASASASA